MNAVDDSLLRKVAEKLSEPPSYADDGVVGSILTVSAASYAAKPTDDEITQPTGFDPMAAALFEAVVESAYLVANADGEFDDAERKAFKHVVVAACGDQVEERQIDALVADLSDQLSEDGIDKRVEMVARTIGDSEHAREVLRIAGLIAFVSGGVSSEERDIIQKLADQFGLDSSAVDSAIAEVEKSVAS